MLFLGNSKTIGCSELDEGRGEELDLERENLEVEPEKKLIHRSEAGVLQPTFYQPVLPSLFKECGDGGLLSVIRIKVLVAS